MIEISKELSKHWNILLTEEGIADAYKNSNRHESDCFVLATSYYTEVQLNISNLQLIDGVLYADINEVEGLPMNIVKVDVEGGHLIAYYNEGIGQMSRIDLGSVVGPKGDAGAIPNISVGEVVTGAPGSNANVSITGTEEDPVLNFTIPRGAIGEVSEAELSKKLNEKADVISGTVSGDIVTFDGTGGDLFSCVANIEPIQSGTGDPSPTNIRPISGRTGMTVTRAGKNLANFVDGYGVDNSGNVTPSATRTATIDPIIINENIRYRYSVSGSFACVYAVWNGDTLVRRITGIPSGSLLNTSGGDRFYVCAYGGPDTVVTKDAYHPMVTVESADYATYEPYDGQTYPINWQTEAGTVYGGTLDVVSGVLTVDRAIITLDGSQSIRMSNANRGYVEIANAVLVDASNQLTEASVICDRLKPTTWGALGYSGFSLHCAPLFGKGIAFRDNTKTTAADWTAYFTENPTQFSYKLATPQTYQLTPTEVRTLLGGNTIYTDGGTIIAEYPADTEKYIDNSITNVKRLIAGIETDYIATKNYAVGDFLVVKNEFLKVVSAIANGEGIVVGQNVSATTVAEQLILLFNS